ncbi:efflux RND transporter permease subunit [Roseateles saccharophilus]|uniref:Putative RND superfamily exporter protein n=1 Tax=Roseateles saccharophilus TaxID=304 RepID=A0A4R3UL34_ROSSA|nr:MMPL family transporter [Roseateles saccharophilus]MDG0833983.1 transporter [Roseateles saccharophilus]TCU91073.1 putative RND superfamily exporter protein [Roseateles saccharophilus]
MKTAARQLLRALVRAEEWIFANPKIVLGLILAVTLGFATRLPGLRIYTDFSDLLPQHHPYIQTYNRVKENFGGANQIVMAIEVEQGTVFNDRTLALLHRATQGVDNLPSVNHNLVGSLTHRTARHVHLTEEGSFASEPYYDARQPHHSVEELEQLRRKVMANPQVYGLLVSPDLKAVLIKAQLNEGEIDYAKTFGALQALQAELATPGHKIYLTGNPVLTGYVYTYLNQIVAILFYTLALLAALLIAYFRRFYGVFLPLLGIALSSIWGLGFMSWLGFNLEPLSMPIPFLIAARAMSHGVQLVARYYEELAITHSGRRAARNALEALFRPGSLAIAVDAIGIGVMVLGAAPFNRKLGISAGFWAFSVIFTVHFMVPLALTVLPEPRAMTNKNQAVRAFLGAAMARSGGTVRGATAILCVAGLLMLAGGKLAAGVKTGETEPGSPILHRDHAYNLSTEAINRLFPGSEELHIVAGTAEKGGIKRPDVLRAIEAFQAEMLADPNLGGTKALPTVVRVVNRLTHNDDPRWAQIPDSADEVGGLMFAYLASSPIPGALKEFVNADENEADLVFYYKDRQAETINRALALAHDAARRVTAGVPDLKFEPAGGIIGVSAAANEALHTDHLLLVPLVMVLAFVVVMAYYQSVHAGWLMVLPMLFSTVLSYAYMGWKGISISVNTVPVIMVGVGVGIDYAVYFMDRIREEMPHVRDVRQAAINAVSTTGYAVSFTALTLTAGVILWVFLSDLRFQSDAAALLSFMLVVNAIAAILIVPAWCVVFKPRFVVEGGRDTEVGQELPGAMERPAEAVA